MIGYSVFSVSQLEPKFVFAQFNTLLKERYWNIFYSLENSFNPSAHGKLYFKDNKMYELWDEKIFSLNDEGEGAFLITYQFFNKINMQSRLIELVYPNMDTCIGAGDDRTPHYYIFSKKIYEYELILPANLMNNMFSESIANIFLEIFKLKRLD